MKTRASILAIMAMLWSAVSQAQTFSIDWFTVDGGGGTSTGGVFKVSGTVGQADAGAMGGGGFLLQGGFWSGIAVQTPGAPFLYITNGPAGIVVYWERPATGFVL